LSATVRREGLTGRGSLSFPNRLSALSAWKAYLKAHVDVVFRRHGVGEVVRTMERFVCVELEFFCAFIEFMETVEEANPQTVGLSGRRIYIL